MNDLYHSVTERVITALEAGTPPWVRPWSNSTYDHSPANLATSRAYRGINVLLLNLEAQLRGFEDNRWLTFRQTATLGGHIRKGERGTTVVFFKWHEVGELESSENAARRVIPLLRSFTVFNACQVDALPDHLYRIAAPPMWTPVDAAERVLSESGATIKHGGNQAFYTPSLDHIQLPQRSQFATADAYYAVGLHELAHWTGHPTRCNRPLNGRYGLEAYAFEELVAEMGAAFLCAHCRLPARLEHASYIDSWLQALKDDKRLIFVAAGKAQAAADYVLSALGVAPSPAAEAEAA